MPNLSISQLVGYLLIAASLFNGCIVLNRILNVRPFQSAYSAPLTVDSNAYFENAKLLSEQPRRTFPDGIFHSFPIRLLLAELIRYFGIWSIPIFKLLNFFCWVGIAYLVGKLALRFTHNLLFASLSVFCVTSSEVLGSFTAILQHEIFMGLLVTVFFYLETSEPSRWRSLLSGLVVMGLCACRFSFLLLLPYPLMYRGISKSWAKFACFAVAFFLPAILWNLGISLQHARPYWFHPIGAYNFQRYLNVNARPYNFPFYEVAPGPIGLQFIWQFPMQYLTLLKGHFAFLFGLIPDVWFLESRAVSLLHWVSRLSLGGSRLVWFALQIGLWICGLAAVRSHVRWLTGSLLLALCVPHLLMGGSTRFLIPFLPCLVVLQIVGLQSLCSASFSETSRRWARRQSQQFFGFPLQS